MPGPVDSLRGMMGGGGKSPAGMQSMPGFSSADLANLKEAEGSLASIAKLAKKGSKELNKLGSVKGLAKAEKALSNLKNEEAAFNAVMADGTSDVYARSAAYERLADAQRDAEDAVKDHTKAENELSGMLGRTKNVLGDVATKSNLVKMAFAGVAEIAGVMLNDMSQGFEIMARSGQVLEGTFTSLGAATAYYSGAMRLASVEATAMGQSATASNAAFAKLTETYGASGAVVEELSAKWADMSAVATLSGLGLEDVANMASQGFRRLGEDLDTTMGNVKLMAETVTDLNAQFGDGAVNSKEFSNAVQSLAHSSSFLNQNTRLVTESLGRELKMQLALGRAPEAALKKAQQNLELAGKVNIVGIIEFRNAVQAEYNAFEAGSDEQQKFLEDFAEKHGSEGKILAGMLEAGTLTSSENLFAVEQAVKNGASLQSDMMDSMRASASEGDIGALIAKGLSIGEAQYMRAESRQLTTDIQGTATGTTPEKRKARAALLGDDYAKDPKKLEFLKKVESGVGKEGGFGSKAAQQKAFLSLDTSRGKDIEGGPKSPEEIAKETRNWIDAHAGVRNLAAIAASVKNIPDLLGTLPKLLAGALTLVLGKKLLNRLVPSPFSGSKVGMGARMAKAMPTFARAGGGAMKGVRALGGFAGKALGGLGKLLGKAGPIGLAISTIAGFGMGMAQASEIFKDVDVGAAEYAAAGIGGAVNMLTMGLIDTADAARTTMDLGGWMKNLLGGDDPLAPTESDKTSSPEDIAKQRAFLRERGKLPPPTSTKVSEVSTVAGEAGAASGGAVASGSLSGGSLILEVQNWDAIYAQSVNDAATGGL